MKELSGFIDKIKDSDSYRHETKRHSLKKFLILLSIFLIYFIAMSFKYGIQNGFHISILTWSFFVFCTPIADAGFLVDFPARMLTGIRMLHSEILVWITASIINLYSIIFTPDIYTKNELLRLLKYIFFHPIPFWLIIILSAIGTYLSIYFGDELIDIAKYKDRKKYFKHKNKFFFIVVLFLIVTTILLYYYLLERLGISI